MAAPTETTTPQSTLGERLGDGQTQYAPTAWTRRTGMITCLVVATMVGVMIAGGLIRAQSRPDKFVAAAQELNEGLAKLPFTARLPQPVPDGAKIVGTILQEPDEKRGPSIFAIEATYTLIGDDQGPSQSARYVRVWQTNDVYLRKQVLDPLGDRSDPTTIDGDIWYRQDGQAVDRQAGVSYSTRYDDGITLVVSGPDEKIVLDVIDALTRVSSVAVPDPVNK